MLPLTDTQIADTPRTMLSAALQVLTGVEPVSVRVPKKGDAKDCVVIEWSRSENWTCLPFSAEQIVELFDRLNLTIIAVEEGFRWWSDVPDDVARPVCVGITLKGRSSLEPGDLTSRRF